MSSQTAREIFDPSAALWGMDKGEVTALEVVLVVVTGVAVVVGGGSWAGAALAVWLAGGSFDASFGDALTAVRALPSRVSEPAAAWPGATGAALPGPVLYWLSTAAVAMAAVIVAVALLRWWGRRKVGTIARRPLGVDARPRFARRRELAPVLLRRPEPGRFVLGQVGRRLVATEAGGETRGARAGGRGGDRGAVALIGPSRSGKTTAAVGGILEWSGPAVLSSVKADLLATTVRWRRGGGDVRVYDPTGSTALASATWSPLRAARTFQGAQRAARALCDAAPRQGVDGGLDFWLAQAEILLAGLLLVAARTGRDMSAVCEWVMVHDHPGEHGPGEVGELLEGLVLDDPEAGSDAVRAGQALAGIWKMEERTRSSVYATAQTVVWPWADPGVAAASRGPSLDLEWLLRGSNTVYLSAPIEDQQRLAPAFGGLLNDLIKQVYLRVAMTGRPLDPPLLIVIDEAGNTPLRALPEYASTLAGLGVLLVTIWQSVAQIESAYRRQADTILTNHLTKVFYAGLSDPASLRYVAQVLGDAEVETLSRSGRPFSREAVQLATTRVALAPPHALRQMRPGDALLVHGTLPPVHMRTRPWWRDRMLSERVEDGKSSSRPQLGRLTSRVSWLWRLRRGRRRR